MQDLYAYTEAEERIYSAYLAVAPDGTTTTLIGVPGMDPVQIRKAGGADHGGEPLPDIPGDGSWIPASAETPPTPVIEKAAKASKAVTV